MDCMILKVSAETVESWVILASILWESDIEKLMKEYELGKFPHEYLYQGNGEYAGFISLSIRHDYVESSHSSPVAYIEGIYVLPSYQRRAIGLALIEFAKNWSRDNKCSQLGSDTPLDNLASQAFHEQMGFTSKAICTFIMDIAP